MELNIYIYIYYVQKLIQFDSHHILLVFAREKTRHIRTCQHHDQPKAGFLNDSFDVQTVHFARLCLKDQTIEEYDYETSLVSTISMGSFFLMPFDPDTYACYMVMTYTHLILHVET